MTGLGPFDLTGGPFLTLYAVLFAITFVAGLAIPRWLRPEGRMHPINDTDRLAYLAGGATRFGEALVVRLLAKGNMLLDGGGKLTIRGQREGQGSAERSVLMLPSPASWPQVTKVISQDARALDDKLTANGLLMDRALRWQMRFWQVSPYIALVAFGLVKWEVGTLRDKPVGILTGFLIAAAIFGLIRFCALDARTRSGIAAVKDAQLQSDRLRRAPMQEETALAVALFGTGVLAGSSLSGFHQLRSSSGDSGGGSSDGGGCGGGGCGG